MPITRMRNWNKTLVCMAGLLAGPAVAQQLPAIATPPQAESATSDSGDALVDALTCRSDNAALPGLIARLRRERPNDFRQTDRQYSDPPMDLYRLEDPVNAWGHESDAVVFTANRVLMVVPGPVEMATKQLEDSLAASAATPLSGALDDQHALVLYAEQRPGLQQRVLIGCEYRVEGLSLIDDPQDAWRRPPKPALPATGAATTRTPPSSPTSSGSNAP